ncbi:MAG: SRPBCC family protein [Bacteroidota bacterium]
MPTIETTVEIVQPPEIVAEAFLDPANAVHWTTDLERLEVISGNPGEVGSAAHLHYAQKGRPHVLVDVLEETVPNQYFRSRVEGGGLKAHVETWLRRRNDRTEVTIRWRGSGTRLVTRLLLPLLRGAIRRRTQSDLATFKKLVETNGAHFSR